MSTMSQRRHLTDSKAWRVVGGIEGGQTQAERVAQAIGDRGGRNNPAFVHESVRFGGGECWVYGGISIDGAQSLYIIRDGPLTACRYRDDPQTYCLVSYTAAIGDDFILINDNCRPHRAQPGGGFPFRGKELYE
ncbi:transposable element Tcb2 transposase [Trichonephila clavipes]|nr:transposable element Tcb2 transposase [Trichonephila clavipes]